MKYLFIFLKKQSFFFIFIFLEGIALILFFNHSSYQRSTLINSTNVISGSLNLAVSSVRDYFHLVEANEQLNRENARLYNLLQQSTVFPYSMIRLKDTTFSFIPARVISNTTRGRNNFIMIDKGRLDGVEKEMGLISPLGIAGMIVEVSNHYATAMSLLHKDSKISARLKRSGQMVNVSWNGKDYRIGLVEDIPTHISPMPGDTVLTSGYSFVFPANIMIGTIGENIFTGGNLHKAELLFSTDFNNLLHVIVTKNNAISELDSLDMDIRYE
jgi:rod shape-determining protein MreC